MSDVLTELRSFRIEGISVFDLTFAVVGTEIVFRYLGLPKYSGAISAVPIGVAVHYALGIDTPLNRKLGLANQ